MSAGSYAPTVLLSLFTFLLPICFGIGFAVMFGAIAVSMAKKRELPTTPAFFAGLFGGPLALFIIALFPKKGPF